MSPTESCKKKNLFFLFLYPPIFHLLLFYAIECLWGKSDEMKKIKKNFFYNFLLLSLFLIVFLLFMPTFNSNISILLGNISSKIVQIISLAMTIIYKVENTRGHTNTLCFFPDKLVSHLPSHFTLALSRFFFYSFPNHSISLAVTWRIRTHTRIYTSIQ